MIDLGDNLFVAINEIIAIIDLTSVKDSRDTRDFLRSAHSSEPDYDNFKTAIILCAKDGGTRAVLSSSSTTAIRSRIAQTDVTNFI